MSKMKSLLAGAGIVALIGGEASAAGWLTNGMTQAGQSPYTNGIPLTGNELAPFDTQLSGGAMPQTEAVSIGQLANYNGSLASKNNGIIAGDASTNLWQRGTSGTSSTSATVQWSSADHWGQWATASAGVKIVKDTTAADLPAGYSAAYALTHTATTAGQICMGQPLETVDSLQFAGQTAELDFHAATGSGYTGGATFTAYIVTGTGTDDGLNKMAYTVNAGGATGWTGGANATAAVVPLSAVSTSGRFAAVAKIPAGTTEIGVAFCYTTTTADTNDQVAITGIQLVRNAALTSVANATAALPSTTAQLTSFQRRLASEDQLRQYRYYYQVNEFDTVGVVQSPGGYYVDTTHCQIAFSLPAPMFKAPTIQNSAITNATFKVSPGSVTPVALAGSGNSGLILAVGSSPSAPFTVGVGSFITTTETIENSCVLVSTAAGAGNFGFTAED